MEANRTASRLLDTAARTMTGTEVHSAPEGFSRTNCGCRVNSRISAEDLASNLRRGRVTLCAKCWGPASQAEAPDEWLARFGA